MSLIDDYHSFYSNLVTGGFLQSADFLDDMLMMGAKEKMGLIKSLCVHCIVMVSIEESVH